MKYIVGECPECKCRVAAAMFTTERDWQDDIAEFLESGLAVQILRDPVEQVMIVNHAPTCSRHKNRYAAVSGGRIPWARSG